MATVSPYPLFLNLDQQPVLVVGGGRVGLRKVRGLLAAGSRVTVVSPAFAAEFETLAAASVEKIVAPYSQSYMAREKWRLVFAATDVRHINELVSLHAHAAGVLCCRCDEPEQGDFSGGATQHVTERRESASEQTGGEAGPIVLAVSTSGASPGLAVRICKEAAGKLDPIWAVYARLLAEWRAVVKTLLADDAARRALLQRLTGEEMESLLRREGEPAAHARFNEWLEEARRTSADPSPPSPPFRSERSAMPSNAWIHPSLLLATSLLFAAAFVLGLFHLRRAATRGTSGEAGSAKGGARDSNALPHESSMGPFARGAMAAGTVMGIGLFVWRAVAQQTVALAISDPFDVFLALGMLLALLVIYFRWTRHLRSLSFFLLPMISLLLLLGLVLAVIHPGENADYHNLWHILHITSIVAATALFALGCVGGVVYLLADRQLRRKGLDTSHRWIGLPPLASIEKLMQWMIYIGFPLLTVATVAGVLLVSKAASPEAPTLGPRASLALKITFGILSWTVYAVLLQVPLNPRFRGRRAAWLSITGFVLFIGAFAAASWS